MVAQGTLTPYVHVQLMGRSPRGYYPKPIGEESFALNRVDRFVQISSRR